MNDYIARLRQVFPDRNEVQLELMLSASRALREHTGLSAHEHRKRAMEKMFPSRVWHEWREQRIASVQECIENRIKELNWIGSSSSNKSADMADIALTLWWTKPEMTTIYITSPYEKATEEGVWAYVVEQFEEARASVPGLPGKRRLSDNSIILYDRNPRSFIKLATVDQVGKLVGKKAKSATEGLLVIIVDEFPAFSPTATRSFLSVMTNLRSNKNLLVITAGNFASTSDGLGTFCDPDERDIPGGYDAFDPDRHFRWRTKRGGLALRFDGLQSPNVKAGRDIYPFVTTIEYIQDIANSPGGLESPDAMRFVRSAPIVNLDEFGILNSERIDAGGAKSPYTWTSEPIKLIAFFDPGFGGDPCILQKFKLGYGMVNNERKQIFALWEPPHTIPIRVGAKKEDGTPYTPEEQITDAARDHCRSKGIPDEHVGYDGSLRASMVQAVATRWSTKVRPFDSNGEATDRKTSAGSTLKWKDVVDRYLSEMWFSVVSLIDSGQLKDLQLSPKAIVQFCQRRWSWAGGRGRKKKVQRKDEYKDMLREQQKPAESPNEADAVVGGVQMARELGLIMDGVAIRGGAAKTILELMQEMELRRQMKFAHRPMGRPALPSGTLHAMKRETRNGSKLRRYQVS